ncbi:MAG TPA: DsrE family protein [Anaeromyxobacteraceae bacterium]|nr:DsrE family protein [Anaeromyxobacteraceae bacterium]
MSGPVVVFLRDGAWDARWTAVSTALTAAALGEAVHLALFGDALRAFASGTFDDGAPPQAASLGPSLTASLDEARAALGVKVVACETAVRLAGLDPAGVVPPLDALVSLPALWSLARDGRLLSF